MDAKLLERVSAIAVSAGERILEFYGEGTDLAIEHKADDSPLTRADRAAHELICGALRDLTPEIPVLSEESESHEGAARHEWHRFWLVDPLDGTKEFLKRTGEFTVNVALIEEAAPVLGVVHVPVSGVSYLARRGGGAFRAEAGGEPRPVRSRRANPGALAVVASRDHAGPAVRAMLTRLPGASTLSMGSALKFCLVAEGSADLYFRDLPTMEWDTAAAQCVVEEAGGAVTDVRGQRLQYNKTSLRNPAIITVGDLTFDWWAHVGFDERAGP